MTALTISTDDDLGLTLTSAALVTSTGIVTNILGPDAVEASVNTGITNYGLISALGIGVALNAGGYVDNKAGGIITGAVGVDVYGFGAVDNAGYITGIAMGVEAQLANVTNARTGKISGGFDATSGTLVNYGTIDRALGTVINFSDGGTVDNFGSAAYLAGGDVLGVQISGGIGDVDNQGTILGVNLALGGTVENAGYIRTGNAAFGIEGAGRPVNVVNSGDIVGIALYNGGSINNSTGGTISGYLDGIDLKAGGTVMNAGQVLGIGARFHAVERGSAGLIDTGSALIENTGSTSLIQGSTFGIDLTSSIVSNVTVINDGTIIGGSFGIDISGFMNTTIINDGTITGAAGDGLVFGGGNNFLSFGATSAIGGIIVGGNASDPATLTLLGPLPVGVAVRVETGGSLILDEALPQTEAFSFSGTGATLSLGDPEQFAGTIYSMQNGDNIDLTSLTFSGAGTVVLETGNMLMIQEDGQAIDLQLNPAQSFVNAQFHLGRDAVNGTDVYEGAAACFLKGTRIATESGEALVEDIRIGDLLRCASGDLRPVKWIGRRHYAAPLPDDPDVIPVCIRAGALADAVPAQDLLISPRHAIEVETYLIPAGALLNGVSVRNATEIDAIEYFHIEMESHDIIFANGAAAETFIDDHSRRMFDNADEFYQLYPQAARGDYTLCRPRLEFGPVLEGLRRKIALRAGVALDQPANETVIGFLEVANRQTIRGWAYAPHRPNMPVSLEILNGGAVLARCIANIPRPDVKTAGFGNGRCGFEIRLPAPLPALMRHEISVRPASLATCLTGSPVIIDPALTDDLLRAGGLAAIIDAAVRSSATPQDISLLGSSLIAAGQNIQLRNAPRMEPAMLSMSPEDDRPVVLILDDAWPTPTLDAGSNALLSHIRAFQELGHRVVFCATAGAPDTGFAAAGVQQLQRLGVECHGQDGAMPETVIRSFTRRRLDIVYMHRFATASTYITLVRHHVPEAKVVYAVADLHHLRISRQAAVTKRPDLVSKAKSVEAGEMWAMRLSDVVLTHSSYEAEYLLRQAPGANVRIVPWAVKPLPPVRRPLPSPRRDIAFIGGPGHAPNLDAVTHLARDIMPLVWAKDPSIKCFVAGPGWSSNFFAKLDPRMVNQGYMTSLEPLLHQVRLTVAPLRFGAGIKGKVFDSLAAATPCIMSDIAAEGLPLDLVLQEAVADGPAMAEKILAAHTDSAWRRALAQAGTAMLKRHFSEAAVVTAMAAAIGVPDQLALLPDMLKPLRLARQNRQTA